MSGAAREILRSVAGLGAEIERRGDSLLVRAGNAAIPKDILSTIREHKAAILTLLRSADDGWSAEDWQALFDERAAIAEYDAGLSRPESEARAHVYCVAEWQGRHHQPSEPSWSASYSAFELDPPQAPIDEAPEHPNKTRALERAMVWLGWLLSPGPVLVKVVEEIARHEGHGWATVEKAKAALGVEAVKLGVRDDWWWQMSKRIAVPQNAPPSKP